MKKIISSGLIAITLVFASVAFSVQTASAETTPTLAVRCSTAQTRLNTLMTRVETTRTTQSATYAEIKGKFDTIVASAATTEYPKTANLTAAQTGLTTKIDAYTAAATAYATSLTAAKNLTCGQSDGDFVKAIVDARLKLATLRTSTLAVRAYVKTDLTTALKDYASWLQTNATNNGTVN